MFSKLNLFCVLCFIITTLNSQTKLEGFFNNVNRKIKNETTGKFEKKQKEYDESNFNYAISFLDNSGLFEADEKGNANNNILLNGTKRLTGNGITLEDDAYSFLKNGEALMAINKYYLAEKSLLQSKILYEGLSKTNTLNYSQVISDLGLLYQSKGRYTKAKPFNEQAIALRKNAENKGMYIVAVNNNAVFYKETSNYTLAEEQFKKALTLANTANDDLAKALVNNNLAMTYLDMNKLKDAETHMNTSITEAAKILKENESNFIKLQINLANIYRFEKKYKESEELYLKAIEVKEKKLGKHPDLAHLKKGLAQLYMEMGKTTEVESLLQSAYDIDKRKLGENNPATLSIQQELANFHRFNAHPAMACELLYKVVEKKKEIYGETHPNYIQALEDLTLAQWEFNKISEAKVNYKTVIDNTLNYINTFFNSLNDNEKTLYWEKTNTRLQRFYSFAMANYKLNDESIDENLVSQLYTTLINTKGFLLNNSSKIRNIIAASTDEDLKATYNKWLEAKENLNQAYQLSKEELTQEKVDIDSLKIKANNFERELSQKSALFKQEAENTIITNEAIQKQLKANEAAIEILQLNTYKNGFTNTGTYVALIIQPTSLKLITIGNAKS